MLNLYLDHFLDKLWVRSHPETPLIRYADDIAIACRSAEEAKSCYEALVNQLRPHGMTIKENEQQAVIDVKKNPAPYLGFLVSLRTGGICVSIGEKAFEHLNHHLIIANRKRGIDGLLNTLGGWIDYFGPAYCLKDQDRTYNRIRTFFASLHRISSLPKKKRLFVEWKLGYERFKNKKTKPLNKKWAA